MSQNARESLSALMDNEGDELELRRVLKSLDDSPDAADAWRRYHLMRSLMRREPGVDLATDLSAGVMARLQDERAPHLEPEVPSTRRSLPFARSAGIAAAVSLMVISGVQFYQGGGGGSEPGLASGPDSQPAPASLATTEGGAGNSARPSLVDLPLFQAPMGASGGGQGLMTVGTGGQSPMFMAPSPRQSLRSDEEQARLLQSYLDRHAEGSAYRSGDAWMPLLRASGSESLGTR
ncbi:MULTISPECIES: sigma-E factor negative regulatory protein [Halomonas]|uniref:Sigma-E factor negative regulatory protein n=1 Tax=Halomonas flagellata TaxID=2920385 RepID=A0ABS9RP36_9GAMM|nr:MULTISPECIES: sigma-E factor negative regulatory protein [Halomonas]MCH4561749.1 sigma-E factor negative regulatory protein [Halomonas flagellata]PXX99463.1 anti-sigma factor [Halomonas sp. LBP4]